MRIAVGTVSLPVLSKALKLKIIQKFLIQNRSIQLSLLLSIPAAGLIIASEEIVNVIGYGTFTLKDVENF